MSPTDIRRPLFREAISAARSAHAFQDSGVHELLHHLFQIALRDALARGDFLGLDRFGARIERDVDHRLEGKQGFSRELEHGSGRRFGCCVQTG